MEHEKGLMANTTAQNGLRSEALGRIVDSAVGLKGLVGPDGKPDMAKVNAALPGAISGLQSNDAFKNAGITTPPPTQITDPQQLDQWIAQIGGARAVTDKVLTQQKETQGIKASEASVASSKASAAEAAARTPGLEAESTIKQAEAAGVKQMTPETIQSSVASRIDPAKYPDVYKRTLSGANDAIRFGLGVKGVEAAIKDGADRITSRENAIAQAQVTSIPFREAALSNTHWQQNQASYQFHAAELDKLTTPVNQLNERI